MIKTKTGLQELECLGVDKIGNDETPPDEEHYTALCQKFRVKAKDVRRPVQVDMLIGQRGNNLHPDTIVRSIDGMKLKEGPLGKTFAGVDKSGTLGGSSYATSFLINSLQQEPFIAISSDQVKDSPTFNPDSFIEETEASTIATSLLCNASQEFLNFFKQENIGVDCTPKCGNCQCGNCAIGGRLRSIKEEREYEVIKSNLEYDPVGTSSDPGPYWRSVFPWTVDRNILGDNKSAVLGAMNATLRKLGKDPSWRKIYEEQLRVLIDNGFARKVEKEELEAWINAGKKTY